MTGHSRAAYAVAAGLFALGGVTAWDASQMRQLATVGVGPQYASYVVAALLALLGAGHVWQARGGALAPAPKADWKAVGWVAVALGALVLVIQLGGGFILAATLLFACTARGLGRRAFPADLLIGAALATLVFLVFNNLLALTLPAGPLERLL